MNALRKGLTPARKTWLETLAVAPAKRHRSRVAFDCMKLGWTEWCYMREDGSPITAEEAQHEFGKDWFMKVRVNNNERLTAEGRRILEEGR